jgi:uncharacterized protein YjbI with pentapeptide repeats
LSDANLSGATLATILPIPDPSSGTNFTQATMTGADLAGDALDFSLLGDANLSDANLSGTSLGLCVVFSSATGIQSVDCLDAAMSGTNMAGAQLNGANLGHVDLSGVDLTGADLTSVSGPGCFTFDFMAGDPTTQETQCLGPILNNANLTDANLSSADLSSAGLTGATLTGATLTGANFSGTLLVPSDQTVSATSSAGAVVTWPTPPPLPGATPGTCTPSSGSTFPVGTTTVTCQVLDGQSNVATGTFTVTVN